MAVRWVLVMTAGSILGCRGQYVDAPRRVDWTAEYRMKIYDRAEERFAVADFFKPPAGEPAGVPSVQFPLIVVERDPDAAESPAQLGGIAVSAKRDCVWDLTKPVVYVQKGFYLRGNVAYEQLTFVWFFGQAAGNPSIIVANALRITMNPDGMPILWETADSHDAGSFVFVAESMEREANSVFGSRLPGRRYLSEVPVDEAPNAVVARVLADSPVPMGPFVYVGLNGSIRTVICRCMPSQVDDFRETSNYDVQPMEVLPDCAIERLPPSLFVTPSQLDRVIRWPD